MPDVEDPPSFSVGCSRHWHPKTHSIDLASTPLDRRPKYGAFGGAEGIDLYAGFGADVWLEPGVDLVDVPSITAPVYRDGGDGGAGTVLVLGAGNVSSIGPMDVLSKMFVENRVSTGPRDPVPYKATFEDPL